MARRCRHGLTLSVVLAVGVAGGLLGLALTPPVAGDVGPGRVEVRLRSSLDGRTEIGVPPLGQVQADTHVAPTVLSAEVESVDIGALQRLLLAQRPTERFVETAEEDVRALVVRFTVIGIVAGATGGAVLAALVWHRRWRRIAITGSIGALTVVALLGATWREYDTQAFTQPTYDGAIERAPVVVEAVSRHVRSLSEVRAQVDSLGHQLAELYAVAFTEQDDPTTRGTTILHVSDIHSNPLALEMVERLAEDFDVDAVLDTGDLTSFGLPIEARITDQVAAIDARYLLVTGNHDSPGNREAIGTAPNVELLRGDVVTVGDLSILGVEDPTYTATNQISGREADAAIDRDAPSVARSVRSARPDVLAVHNDRLAASSFGTVPLIVNGHRHRQDLERRAGTLRLAVGSTGATGLGYFTVDTDQAFEAQILQFVEGCLRTRDYVRVHGIGGDVELQRTTFELRQVGTDRRPRCQVPPSSSGDRTDDGGPS